MPEYNGVNGWNQWAKHVLLELERLDGNDKELGIKIDDFKKELTDKFDAFMKDYIAYKADMRIRASLWGAFSGAIPAIIGTILIFMKLSNG